MKKLARSLAMFIFGNESLTRRLERMAWVHALAKRLHIRELMNAGLARYPLRRTLSGSGVMYLLETFEAVAIEQTYFGNPVFTQIFSHNPPKTFIDLGCNSGIFPCFLTHVTKGRALRGFCVDANETQVKLAKKNVNLNGWPEVHVTCGLVGSTHPEEAQSEFSLAPTSLSSCQFDYQETESGHPVDWKRTTVPTLRVGPTWTQLFGPDLRCGCLKIDIEGSEMSFLRQENDFLRRVDTILIEWHVWTTTPDEVVHYLAAQNFRLDQTIEEGARHGVLFFSKSQ